MEYDVYFDESGDLGWKLDEVFRKNGSSQYFTIAYIILPTFDIKHITRFIRNFHKERKGSYKEFKGADFRNQKARSTSRKIVELLDWNNRITIGAVTVKKSNVPSPLMGTKNDDVLYNHMVKTGLCSTIASLEKVNIIPDKRSVPKGSQNSCSDLLKDELWLCRDSNVQISYEPEESHNKDGLMFIDWIANFVWRSYENDRKDAYQILKPHLQEEQLFF